MVPPRLDMVTHHFAHAPAGLFFDSSVFEDACSALTELQTRQHQFALHALRTEERHRRSDAALTQQRRELDELRQDLA